MQVNVTTECPRCGKKTNLNVSLEEAIQLEEARKLESGALEALESSVTKAMHECPVESFILVAVKNSDGTYAMKSMAGLCSGNRSCTSKIGTLVQEMFVPAKQSAKKKGVEVPEAPEAGAESEAENG